MGDFVDLDHYNACCRYTSHCEDNEYIDSIDSELDQLQCLLPVSLSQSRRLKSIVGNSGFVVVVF